MASIGHTTVEVKIGPILVSAIGVLRAAEAALELVPEWHVAERDKLRKHIKKFKTELLDAMKRSREG
jgi:hypothetical protein